MTHGSDVGMHLSLFLDIVAASGKALVMAVDQESQPWW
jgi:hypothetical protein